MRRLTDQFSALLLVVHAREALWIVVNTPRMFGFAVLAWALMNSSLFAADPMLEASRYRPAVDAQTGKAYREFRMPIGDAPPWKNPDTGTETVWPAELCYWTRDGKATLQPTLVILNEYLGKTGPTICPDCGRTVTHHNPSPPMELMIEAAEGR